MNIENFAQQNEFNGKIFEILQNHFTYEEDSRKMIADLSANVAESTKAITKLTSKMSGRQTRLGIALAVVSVLGYKKIKDLQKRVEALEKKEEE